MNSMDAKKRDYFDLVQIALVDMNGIFRGETLPRTAYKRAERKGIEYFCATPFGVNGEFPFDVPEVKSSNFGNDLFLTIVESLVEVPFSSKPGRRIGQVYGTMIREDGQPREYCPRNRINRLLALLKSYGYTFESSVSYQFTAFKTGSGSSEALGGTSNTNLSAYGLLGAETELLDLARDLRVMGVAVDSISHGDGPGRFELQTCVAEGMDLPDMAARLKLAVKSVLEKRGYSATFMTQPHTPHDTGYSACKFRFALRCRDGQNAFVGENGDPLSDTCRSWIAGMLSNGPAVTALFCPTVNCYRKFDSDANIPRKVDWGIDNPDTFLNVKVSGNGEVWLETCVPSPASNPFFILLGTLAAGYDGLEKNLPCPEASSPEAADIPSSLGTALNAMEASRVIEQALHSTLFQSFLTLKRSSEVKKFEELSEKEDCSEEQVKALERNVYSQFL